MLNNTLPDMVRFEVARASKALFLATFAMDSIACLHVTSGRPCWWSRTKALLSSGN